MGKGTRYEQMLVRMLTFECGYYATRSGASGGGVDLPRPDVFAIRPIPGESTDEGRPVMDALVFEHKSWADATGTLSGDEVSELCHVANRIGARPYICIRPDMRSHPHRYCYRPDELHDIENSPNYSVRQGMHPGRSLDEVLLAPDGDPEDTGWETEFDPLAEVASTGALSSEYPTLSDVRRYSPQE